METVKDYIDRHAASDPDKVYLEAPECGRRMTWSSLQKLCVYVAAHLDAMGVEKGEKVAFLLGGGYWPTALFLGVMYSGRVIAALNARAGASQLSYTLAHSDSKALFISSTYREEFSAMLDEPGQNVPLVLTDEETGPDWPVEIQDAIAPLPDVREDDDAILIYTSGTTGKPKGVLLSHKNVIAGGENVAGAHELDASDKVLAVLPLYHINAQIVTVMAPLVSKGSLVMPRRFSASLFWGLIERYQCTWASLVPTIIAFLLEHYRRSKADRSDAEAELRFEKMRFIRSASAPLPLEHKREFEGAFGITVVDTMGLTETAGPILSNPMPPGPAKPGSPGKAYGNEARIVDTDGKVLGPFETGELMIKGNNVMKGYYKNPEATQAAFDGEGWLHTGDLAYRDEDGFFFVTGRIKELIIKGGENIAPREIDDVLHRHQAVHEAAAFGVPHPDYGQNVMAAVVLKTGCHAVEEELLAHCNDQLGRFKAPQRILILRELPKGPSEKILRTKLSEDHGTPPNPPMQAVNSVAEAVPA